MSALPGRSDIGNSFWVRPSAPDLLRKNQVTAGLLRDPATIDRDHLAGHVVAVATGKERRGAGDVFGIGYTFDHQVAFDDILVGLALALLEADIDKILVELLPQRGDNHARGVTVHGDVVLCQTQRAAFGQREATVFRCAI